MLGVWAEGLSRKSLFAAIRERRTYAATGDRIVLEVALNKSPMGSELPETADREIDVRVTGQDSIASIELIRNGRVIERCFPQDDATEPSLPGRAKCRIQYGWGPWAALDLGRICDWDMSIRIENGKILRSLPCFGASPFDEERRDRLRTISETELHLQSATTRVQCLGEDPTKSLVLEVEAEPEAVLSLKLLQPAEQSLSARLEDLVQDNVVEFTGPFTSESFIIGRLISPSEYSAEVRWTDRGSGEGGPDWYYVRVTQHNGHMAWSSPIWVG